MRVRSLALSLALLAAAACAAPTPAATPTLTALPALPSPSPLTTATAADTATPVPTALPTLEPAASATPPPLPTSLPASNQDPLLGAYRTLLSIQINVQLLAQTATYQQTGRLDKDDLAVAGLALIALTQSVDDSLAGITPPPELAAAWQEGLAAHDKVKSVGALWALRQLDGAQVLAEIGPVQTRLEQTMVSADAALASAYGLKATATTNYRHRIIKAVDVVVGSDNLP